jgi:hypothetical protein
VKEILQNKKLDNKIWPDENCKFWIKLIIIGHLLRGENKIDTEM